MKSKIVLALVLAAFLVSGCVEQPSQPQSCPEDAMVCPDGSVVVRNPALGCQFDPCPQPSCAAQGQEFTEALECCPGLVKAVNTCEKCIEENHPLAFDGIPCCEGLEAADGFCKKPGEPACKMYGESIPVIENQPECCKGLGLVLKQPQEEVLGISGYCCLEQCPLFSPPPPEYCGEGEIIETGTDACGCENPPVCCGDQDCSKWETPENCPEDCA
jgi:hypothetical protein